MCGSFGTFEHLESLVEPIKDEGERELFVRNPGVAVIGTEGAYMGSGFFYGAIYSEEDLASCFEGSIDEIAKSLSALSATADGEFVATAFEPDKLCIARDFFGKHPLFLSKEPCFHFSTSVAGFEDPSMRLKTEDGSTLLVKKGRIVKTYKRPKLTFKKKRIEFFDAMPLILDELNAALARRAAHIREFPVMFSGGIDSALLAKLSLAHADVCLMTIGSDIAEDCEVAAQFEQEMGASLTVVDLDDDVVLDSARDVIAAIGRNCSVMDFELALPAFLAAKHAKTSTLFSGQGADELFGGYFRYQEAYRDSPGAFEKMQLEDIATIGSTNLSRDQLAARANGCTVTTPYLTPKMADIALSTETMARINVTKNKIILRKIAETQGLPLEICQRKKKAMQYGSGLHQLLKQLAKDRGYTKEAAKEAGFVGPLDMLVDSFKQPLE
jgi:asparagine synthase (glutamine-hydrolysing)